LGENVGAFVSIESFDMPHHEIMLKS
jgi:hypothetical protein